jgi:hypothetical protein
MNNTKAKPTPGEWMTEAEYRDGSPYVIYAPGSIKIADLRESGAEAPETDDEFDANANLIAEAGTVYHETGLTPRQLLDQRNALWDAVENIKCYNLALQDRRGPCIEREHMAEIQAAITKVMTEGRKPEGDATA